MKSFFTLLLALSVHCAHAQVNLIMGGINAARLASRAAANSKKAGQAQATAPAGQERYVTPFSYRGQQVSRQRTAVGNLKGKGASEVLALEAALEESHQAMLADSAQSFLPAARVEAIVEAARKAAVARSRWNYAPYHQELAFYQREEARRQKAAAAVPAK
ncbi:hypothetical protein [Hymenobacter metallicola]|uniref:Uncharacterized protein n=1 Tax=Hymenobacter metallicola TaxID=2563114 RepID=A0A4Z0QHL8_9BACT|nr:hypothetical protein [Hymenobacter metallicola]TGE28743.1 hypothetical protein E5K02_04565 [Hymenobacter metallicola]